MLRVPRSSGHVGQLFQCFSCATNNKEPGLAESHLFVILASPNSDEASRQFARNVYIQTHTSAQRHFENPPQTRHALQAPFPLQQSKSVFPEFLPLHERESPQTKTQFAGSAPRGSATQPPYMDMHFQIWEESPKSDLGSEPKYP